MIRMQAVKHYSKRGAGTPPQNFKTERLFRGALTKAVSSGKVFARDALTKAVSSGKVSSTFSKVAGCGAEPRRTAFLFVNFFFAPFSHKEKVAKALIYQNSQ